MSENLKRHRPDIKVLGEGKAIAFMPEDPIGVWCHIQEVRDLLDVKDKKIAELKEQYKDMDVTHTVHIAKMNAKIDHLEEDVVFWKAKAEGSLQISELKARTARSIADEEEMLELGADCPIEQTQVYLKSEADKVIAELEESHKNEVEKLLMKIAGLEKLVETADKLVKQKGGFTVKDISFDGVKLEGMKND